MSGTTPRRSGPRRRRLGGGAVAAAAMLLAVVLSGCSTDGPSSSDAMGSGGGAEERQSAADAAETGRSAGTVTTGVGVEPRSVISVGSVALKGDDLVAVRDEVDRLLGRFGGYVTDERTVNDDDGDPTRSSLQLRVPSSHFDEVMTAFEDFSTVSHTDREATDVTTEVIDVNARVRTQEVSLERLRKFLGRARNVNAMIRLESEIAQREADLGSLLAQQKYLADQTSLATIKVSMTRTTAAGPDDDGLADAGFLAGFGKGLRALGDVVMVGLTVLGALLPFAVVAAVLGAPLWWWLRSVRRRRTPVTAPESVA